jgi:hypothetical protein
MESEGQERFLTKTSSYNELLPACSVLDQTGSRCGDL